MSYSDLRYALECTYDDGRVSRTEKKALHLLLESESVLPEQIHRLRSHAFDLVRSRGGAASRTQDLAWLEETMRVLQHALHTLTVPVSRAYFSPGHDCLEQVLGNCDRARSSIDVCMYTITDNRIARALLRAHDRGVRVRLVTEDEKLEAKGSDIYEILAAGVEVVIDAHHAFMHHKFAVVDGEVLLNGSFNWTRGATEMNWENLVVSHDPKLVAQFRGKFQEYWETLPRLS